MYSKKEKTILVIFSAFADFLFRENTVMYGFEKKSMSKNQFVFQNVIGIIMCGLIDLKS